MCLLFSNSSKGDSSCLTISNMFIVQGQQSLECNVYWNVRIRKSIIFMLFKIKINFRYILLIIFLAKVTQLCPILCDPMDGSPPASSVHGSLQSRILEWVIIPFSRGSSQSDWSFFSYIVLFYHGIQLKKIK